MSTVRPSVVSTCIHIHTHTYQRADQQSKQPTAYAIMESSDTRNWLGTSSVCVCVSECEAASMLLCKFAAFAACHNTFDSCRNDTFCKENAVVCGRNVFAVLTFARGHIVIHLKTDWNDSEWIRFDQLRLRANFIANKSWPWRLSAIWHVRVGWRAGRADSIRVIFTCNSTFHLFASNENWIVRRMCTTSFWQWATRTAKWFPIE